jgi:hypothetical protein
MLIKKKPTNLCLYFKWISTIIYMSNLENDSNKKLIEEYEKIKEKYQKNNNLVQYIDILNNKNELAILVSIQYQTTLGKIIF